MIAPGSGVGLRLESITLRPRRFSRHHHLREFNNSFIGGNSFQATDESEWKAPARYQVAQITLEFVIDVDKNHPKVRYAFIGHQSAPRHLAYERTSPWHN